MCSICLVDNPKYRNLTVRCGHRFHKKCIKKWLKNNYCCPVCREVIQDAVVNDIHTYDYCRDFIIDLVISQVNCSRTVAITALQNNQRNVTNAIVELLNRNGMPHQSGLGGGVSFKPRFSVSSQ